MTMAIFKHMLIFVQSGILKTDSRPTNIIIVEKLFLLLVFRPEKGNCLTKEQSF